MYMKLLSNEKIGGKGTLYTFESAISVIIMIIILSFVIQTSGISDEGMFSKKKLEVYDALKFSDQVGNLRYNVDSLNTTAIESDIVSYTGPGFEYGVVIYNETSPLTAEPNIVGDDVVSISYLISGQSGEYRPREVRVYIW
jgi:hypothetical protein